MAPGQGAPDEPATLISLLEARARSERTLGAVHKASGAWQNVTWGEIRAEVARVSDGLVALGVRPGDRVAIFAATSLRWAICDLAISGARGICVPIYASNTPEECSFILSNSGARILFLDSDAPEGTQPGRLSRFRTCAARAPAVEHVVTFDESASVERELKWEQFLLRGAEQQRRFPEGFRERGALVRPEDASCIIYTSGTTGDPKGVVLTHANWVSEARAVASGSVMEPGDRVMLFLPLAHSFAQAVKGSWLNLGFVMVFAESTEKLLANVAETQATILPSVPRVFEKVYNGVLASGMATPGLRGKLFAWAMGLFDQYAEARIEGREFTSASFVLARRIVFSKLRKTLAAKLGGRMRLFISGGAPLSPKIGHFFDLLGFMVLEGYGLTETSAGATLNKPDFFRIGTVGTALPGVELRIAPDGEVLIRGEVVMGGYYRNPSASAEALDAEGWFHSGDIGELDPQGFLRITDRKKDIIVTAGGKNVAPQNLESGLKTHPIISQAMVYGDKRKFLSVLVTVGEEAARKILADAGAPPVAAYAEYAGHPEITRAVQSAIDALNAREPPYNSLKRFVVLDHDFSQDAGELTPTLKVKRKFCSQKYKTLLDALYDGDVMD